MIRLIKQKATAEQIEEMSQSLGSYIKLAVDVQREILTGGGALHADCEAVLLEDGSLQDDIWGADWIPSSQQVTFESLINIRPRQNNFSLEVQDPELREKIEAIARKLLAV
jgi:hypothetical protein